MGISQIQLDPIHWTPGIIIPCLLIYSELWIAVYELCSPLEAATVDEPYYEDEDEGGNDDYVQFEEPRREEVCVPFLVLPPGQIQFVCILLFL